MAPCKWQPPTQHPPQPAGVSSTCRNNSFSELLNDHRKYCLFRNICLYWGRQKLEIKFNLGLHIQLIITRNLNTQNSILLPKLGQLDIPPFNFTLHYWALPSQAYSFLLAVKYLSGNTLREANWRQSLLSWVRSWIPNFQSLFQVLTFTTTLIYIKNIYIYTHFFFKLYILK